jgi:hypothetical protein
MRFTRIALTTSFTLFFGFIVVPASQPVNHGLSLQGWERMQLADGMPLPPLPPPKGSGAVMVADGMPLPPLPPPKGNVIAQLA